MQKDFPLLSFFVKQTSRCGCTTGVSLQALQYKGHLKNVTGSHRPEECILYLNECICFTNLRDMVRNG